MKNTWPRVGVHIRCATAFSTILIAPVTPCSMTSPTIIATRCAHLDGWMSEVRNIGEGVEQTILNFKDQERASKQMARVSTKGGSGYFPIIWKVVSVRIKCVQLLVRCLWNSMHVTCRRIEDVLDKDIESFSRRIVRAFGGTRVPERTYLYSMYSRPQFHREPIGLSYKVISCVMVVRCEGVFHWPLCKQYHKYIRVEL